MKFTRNARLLRNQLDVTPFAAMFFLLVIFLMLGALVPTPGLPLSPPTADNLPGTDRPSVHLTVDASNRLFFANQLVSEADLKSHLREAVLNSMEPLTLVIQADKDVPYGTLVRLTLLARDAGIEDDLLATKPRLFDAPASAVARP